MDELPSPGALIGGRYRVEAVVGRGAMGVVFAAADTLSGRPVAIKTLVGEMARSAKAVQRFMEEARAMRAVAHPNVVSILDVGRDGQAPFLVMELLSGVPLRARLDRDGRLEPAAALALLIPVCEAVASAHQRGVIHRDLKPENIFLATEGGRVTPKVLDFGIAKSTERVGAAHLTRTGATLGTPAYMSPEQLAKPREATPMFDVYSMGVVLYETLTGRLPYEGANVLEMVGRIAEGNPPPLRALRPEIPARLEQIVLRAMHHDPAARHPSMEALLGDLRAVELGYGATMEAPSASLRVTHDPAPQRAEATPQWPGAPPAYVPPPPRSRAPVVLLAAGGAMVVVLLLAGGVGIAAHRLLLDPPDAPGSVQAPRPATSSPRAQARNDLTMRGGCAKDAGAPALVSRGLGALMIGWSGARSVQMSIGTSNPAPPGTYDIGALARDHGMIFTVGQDEPVGQWTSGSFFAVSRGTVVIHRLQAELGVVELEFRGVVLHSTVPLDASTCRLEGTVTTAGWGLGG